MKLTKYQEKAFELLKQGKNIFLSGPAGVGKSTIIRLYKDYAKKNNIKVHTTATTGIAATLVDGVTIHSWSGVGIGEDSVEEILAGMNFKTARNIRSAKVLVIDEISMLSPELFEKIEGVVSGIRGRSRFGGLQVIFSGDFFQLPPVRKSNSTKPKVSEFLFDSQKFRETVDFYIELTEIIRQTDLGFQTALMGVRSGNLDHVSKGLLRSRLKNETEVNGVKPTKLYPHKASAERENMLNINKLIESGAKSYTYNLRTTLVRPKVQTQAVDHFIKNISKYTLAYEKLTLTVGCQVMCIRNLNTEEKLANGTRGVVTELDETTVKIRTVNGKVFDIQESCWYIQRGDIKVEVTQVPLIPAYAITIHKSQGMTIDLLSVDLGANLFEYNQGYTAISRARTLEGLFILKLNFKKLKTHPKITEAYKNDFYLVKIENN